MPVTHILQYLPSQYSCPKLNLAIWRFHCNQENTSEKGKDVKPSQAKPSKLVGLMDSHGNSVSIKVHHSYTSRFLKHIKKMTINTLCIKDNNNNNTMTMTTTIITITTTTTIIILV